MILRAEFLERQVIKLAKPQEEPHDREYLAEVDWLYRILFKTVETPDLCKTFLKDLLTDSELRMIQNRWRIARLLDLGKPIREVAKEAQVGTDTVERISKRMSSGTGGLLRALEVVRGELRKIERRRGKKTEEGREAQDAGVGRWVFGSGQRTR